jgi:hypothetical protein
MCRISIVYSRALKFRYFLRATTFLYIDHLRDLHDRAKMATSVDAKLLKSTKFPVEFNQKVDMQKVNVEVMKK